MCFSEEAALYALIFLLAHCAYFALVWPLTRSSPSPRARRLRQHALLFCLAWITMEFFDWALWRAHIAGRCYDLVGYAGHFTVALTMGALNFQLWCRLDPSMDGWDVQVFFGGMITFALVMLASAYADLDLMPRAPLNGRNVWLSDNLYVWVPLLWTYATPMLRALPKLWVLKDADARFCLRLTIVTMAMLVIALGMSFATWGSIWCFGATFMIGLYDLEIAQA